MVDAQSKVFCPGFGLSHRTILWAFGRAATLPIRPSSAPPSVCPTGGLRTLSSGHRGWRMNHRMILRAFGQALALPIRSRQTLLRLVQLAASNPVQQPTGDNAVVSLGLSNWRPPHSPEQPSSIGFRMRSDGSIDEGRTGNAKPFDAGLPALGANPPLDRDMGQRPEFQSWWSQALRQGEGYDGASNCILLASRRRRT